MKLQIRLTPEDKTFSIPITSRNNMLGYDDNIESLVNAETNNSINNVSDSETRRILPASIYGMTFNFWNGSNYVTSVAPLEFTASTYIGSTQLTASFYIIQLYDSFSANTQTKYHTGYYNGFDFNGSLTSSFPALLTGTTEFSNLYLSQNLLDSMSGLTTDFYVKFSFYSGKSGKFYSFSRTNPQSNSLSSEDLIYNKISVNPVTLTYTFAQTPNVYEIVNNPIYDTLINNTVPSFPVEKVNYPSGNTFTTDGTYITL